MSEKCSVATCPREKHALCHGCLFNFCREHMFEHSLSTHLQLNPLIDQVNLIQDQLKDFNPIVAIQAPVQQFEEWRQRAHQAVDTFFAEKVQELQVYVAERMKLHERELLAIRARIQASMKEQDTTHELISLLTFKVQCLQRDTGRLLRSDFQIRTNPLVIDRNVINFDDAFDMAKLAPAYKTFSRSYDSYTPLATDNQFLLVHHQGTLSLFDESFVTYKKVPWTSGPIFDMCYSSTLQHFIIINAHNVFLLHKETMSIGKVRSIPHQEWFACTCSDTALYLSTKVYSSSVVQFDLLRSMAFVKRWESPETCEKDEAIDAIVYANETLALMISNDTKKFIRLDLRVAATMAFIWSLPLDLICNDILAYRFCSINRNEWLVADHVTARFLHVASDGKVKGICRYDPAPCCAVRFGHDTLAVSSKALVNLNKF